VILPILSHPIKAPLSQRNSQPIFPQLHNEATHELGLHEAGNDKEFWITGLKLLNIDEAKKPEKFPIFSSR